MTSIADQLIERGREEGQRTTLLKQLRSKFGKLPDAATARVNGAEVAELDLWLERILSASTLDDVFSEA
jgi:hypothetical protein